MGLRIAVISLMAEDVLACAHFYRDVIGLPFIPQHSEKPHFDIGGTVLVLIEGRSTRQEAAGVGLFPLIAISVDDLDAAIQKLQAHQVELPWGIEGHKQERWVKFHDPAGNLIELVQMPAASFAP